MGGRWFETRLISLNADSFPSHCWFVLTITILQSSQWKALIGVLATVIIRKDGVEHHFNKLYHSVNGLICVNRWSVLSSLCSRGLLKTPWEKKKLLVTSNFSFSHSVFYPFGELSTISSKLKLSSTNAFSWEESKIMSFCKDLRFLFNDSQLGKSSAAK